MRLSLQTCASSFLPSDKYFKTKYCHRIISLGDNRKLHSFREPWSRVIYVNTWAFPWNLFSQRTNMHTTHCIPACSPRCRGAQLRYHERQNIVQELFLNFRRKQQSPDFILAHFLITECTASNTNSINTWRNTVFVHWTSCVNYLEGHKKPTCLCSHQLHYFNTITMLASPVRFPADAKHFFSFK